LLKSKKIFLWGLKTSLFSISQKSHTLIIWDFKGRKS